MNALTGAPVAGVRVSANPVKGGKTLIVWTDAAGHFQFPATASAISQVVLVRPGFLAFMKPCSPTSKLRIELPPAAVITGKVEDEDGFPVAHAYVQAIRDQYFYGEHRQRVVAIGRSDHQGSYRLTDLPGGRFWIRVASVDLERPQHPGQHHGPELYGRAGGGDRKRRSAGDHHRGAGEWSEFRFRGTGARRNCDDIRL